MGLQQCLVIVRKKTVVGMANSWTIFVNGQAVGLLRNGAAVSLPITPGAHSILVRGLAREVPEEIVVPVGEHFLVRLAFGKVSASETISEAALQEIPSSEAPSQTVTVRCEVAANAIRRPCKIGVVVGQLQLVLANRLLERNVSARLVEPPENPQVLIRITNADPANWILRRLLGELFPVTLEIEGRFAVEGANQREFSHKRRSSEGIGLGRLLSSGTGQLSLSAIFIAGKIADDIIQSLEPS